MNEAITLLNKILEENNLVISLNDMKARAISDGGFIIEKPQLVVNFRQQKGKTDELPKGSKQKVSKASK